MAHDFKVGDKVKIGPENGGYPVVESHGIYPGSVGTVAHVKATGKLIGVCFADAAVAGPTSGWNFYPDELEPVEE